MSDGYKLPNAFRFAVLRRYAKADGEIVTQRVSVHKKWENARSNGRRIKNQTARIGGLSTDYYVYDMYDNRALTLTGNDIKGRTHSVIEIYGMAEG